MGWKVILLPLKLRILIPLTTKMHYPLTPFFHLVPTYSSRHFLVKCSRIFWKIRSYIWFTLLLRFTQTVRQNGKKAVSPENSTSRQPEIWDFENKVHWIKVWITVYHFCATSQKKRAFYPTFPYLRWNGTRLACLWKRATAVVKMTFQEL